MSSLGIAALQLAAAKDDNLELVERETRAVAKRFPWVDMVVLGELAIHGASLDKAEPAGGETETRLKALALETGLWLVPGSLYERRAGAVFNTTPVINPAGDIVARYDKIFPFLPYETGVTAGRDYVVFDMPGAGRVGVAICYDMWFPEVIRTLVGLGAEVILLPTMTNTIDRDVELAIARANAAMNQCFFVDVNLAGDLGVGRSAIYGPGGDVVYEAGAGREVIALDIDLSTVSRMRERGWNGLGQVLKSFRDSEVEFPLHADIKARRASMTGMGELAMPRRPAAEGAASSDARNDHKPRLKILD
ncbi:hydrolase [Maricaulis sp. W15]|uniref:carbon-nitrogen hydrolase family protein n=1 Tax=Maricaulis sp. W15 TaxID=1772333 RepID=UPI000948E827|nr:carbon-nitrogen hydrolase family protein [Maricaulis sp. W15]OLF75537.1 hydrolase [Maricaulis sp. W15]